MRILAGIILGVGACVAWLKFGNPWLMYAFSRGDRPK